MRVHVFTRLSNFFSCATGDRLRGCPPHGSYEQEGPASIVCGCWANLIKRDFAAAQGKELNQRIRHQLVRLEMAPLKPKKVFGILRAFARGTRSRSDG
jgi:hypothetical protein